MLNILLTNSTLAFDSFGDIVIQDNDLKVVRGTAAKVQIIVDFLKTNKNDYIFHPSYGVDYDSFIGKGIEESLVRTIVKKVDSDLKKLDILQKEDYSVYGGIVGHNAIQIRIILKEDETIFIDIDNINGVTIGQ